MKKLITLLLIAIASVGIYAQRKDLTPNLSIEGVLKTKYSSFPAGTPVTVMSVTKLTKPKKDSGIYLATTINNTQVAIPSHEAGKVIEFHPKNMEQFWMTEYNE